MELIQRLKYNFARNLQKLRAKNKLTQAGLAEKLNVQFKEYSLDIQRTSIVNYESEHALPRLDVMYCMARFFGQSIDDMLEEEVGAPKIRDVFPEYHYYQFGFGTAQQEHTKPAPAPQKNAISEDTLKQVAARYSEAIAYRQFFQEFVHQFYHTLKNEAESAGEKDRINTTFYKVFLGCRVSKGKFFQDLINNALSDTEKQVFIAFQDPMLNSGQIAEALDMTPEDLAKVLAGAQSKINEYLIKQSNF